MTKTRLRWHTQDITRTALTLAAYALLGVGIAAIVWGCLAAVVAVAKSL